MAWILTRNQYRALKVLYQKVAVLSLVQLAHPARMLINWDQFIVITVATDIIVLDMVRLKESRVPKALIRMNIIGVELNHVVFVSSVHILM